MSPAIRNLFIFRTKNEMTYSKDVIARDFVPGSFYYKNLYFAPQNRPSIGWDLNETKALRLFHTLQSLNKSRNYEEEIGAVIIEIKWVDLS